jgi:hypothetical protein
MKKLFLLLVLLFVIYLVTHRQRLFLRDPLAHVTREGVKDTGAQVYINFTNDVLLKSDHGTGYLEIVQHGGNIGTPATLHCLQWVACQTDANAATLSSAEPIANIQSMTTQQVAFTDPNGKPTVVTLH